ncbi:MAG: glutaminase A [Verrucomicrobiota bacterium]
MDNTISRILAKVYENYRGFNEGAVADYIPELTSVDPNWYGICVFTTDGYGYAIGDAEQPFTIQSISKAFTFGMILDDHGPKAVDARIGVEPSGEAFNSISLDPETGRPLNPMINAGAIAATGMVQGSGFEDRFERIRSRFSAFAGSELSVDEAVYRSESATGFRNRAIAYLLRNVEKLDDPVDEAVEVYFKQCSILVTCRDLAVMAASLANGGVNPVTGERVLQPENVEKVLSVMSTCGMYDYSGEWIFRVGLPAKSGVGGGVLGVLPGQLGVAVFSPRLDVKGNSVRGVKTFVELSQSFNLHLFNYPVVSGHVIRRHYKLSDVGSNRQRLKSHHDTIREHGDAVRVIELQGDIFFTAMERLVRLQTELFDSTNTFVVDLTRVSLIDRATEDILLTVASDISDAGKRLIVIDPSEVIDRGRFDSESVNVAFSSDLDTALEFCEDQLIDKHVEAPMVSGLVPFHDFELFQSLDSNELSRIEGLLEMESFDRDCKIVEQGEDPDYMYLLAKGSVGIHLSPSNGAPRGQRVAAFCPGVCFGDLAVVDGSNRSADVWANEPSTCYLFSLASLARLAEEEPVIHSKILRNILLINIDRLRRCNQEIGSLKS